MNKLFVFGTLKRGFPLHSLLGDALYLGTYRTLDRYPMLVAGPWYAPVMLNEPGRGEQVSGELYDVSAEQLAAIDAAESIGTPGNDRTAIWVVGGVTVWSALVYTKAPSLAVPAHSGFLSDYQDRRFVAPWERRQRAS